MNDNDLIDKSSLDNYLTKEFIPYVTSFYDVTEKAHTSMDEIFQLFIEAIKKGQLGKDEVRYIQFAANYIVYNESDLALRVE